MWKDVGTELVFELEVDEISLTASDEMTERTEYSLTLGYQLRVSYIAKLLALLVRDPLR